MKVKSTYALDYFSRIVGSLDKNDVKRRAVDGTRVDGLKE